MPYYQNCFSIPNNLISNRELGDYRIAVFSYLAVHRGIDYSISFTAIDIVQSLEKKTNRHPGQINSEIQLAIDQLIDAGYLILLNSQGQQNYNSIQTVRINQEKINSETSGKKNRFAVLYTDEVEKLASCSYKNKGHLFTVFAFLRSRISKRKNLLEGEFHNDIDMRKREWPEVFDEYYSNIANELCLSSYLVQKSSEVLEELGLIHIEEMPRRKYKTSNGQDRWCTGHMLFCNTYKREREYHFIEGKKYYREEIANKRVKLTKELDKKQNGGD